MALNIAYKNYQQSIKIEGKIARIFVIFGLNALLQAFYFNTGRLKTKTQEKNSSQKIKDKTQPLGGFSLQVRKLKKKTKISS